VLHANGIALLAGRRTIYHSDTRAGVIFVHDLDRAGNATRRRTWAMSDGQPTGSRWTSSAASGRRASAGGWPAVDRYRPDGRVERSLAVPRAS